MSSSSLEFLHTTSRQLCDDGCLRSWKIGFAAILLVEGLLFAHIVYFLKRASTSSTRLFNVALRLGNALSAGIFLATGLLHILPEASALLDRGESHHEEESHRLQTAARRVLSALVREEDEHEDEHEDDDHHEEHEEHEGEDAHHQFPWSYLVTGISFYVLFFIEQVLLPKFGPSDHQHSHSTVHSAPSDIEENKSEAPARSAKGFASAEFIQGVVQVIAISAHSLFESMALGLASSFNSMLNIFIATVSHRWATSAALAFKLVKHLHYFPFLVLMTAFSVAVPAGIAIGAALSSLSTEVQGVLFSVSAGAFIYIGVFEVMAEEYVKHRDWKLRKFLCTVLGAAIITVITVVLHVTGVHG
ncbi:Zinc transporter ZIP3 [Gracilariopsis chorda]|uniref:Zinc transporter ZIP3 n=1 Tax=Gracilariopsis chorda TaxID=448386 RepID=A0A2V3IZT6_9FLOR|nr:Zinc transporter ZIP3 [Gracilariopsis chorda]|eukprot:PXF47609.1 Zinc transporter ZIP3 [Gracilariopsis chorda]